MSTAIKTYTIAVAGNPNCGKTTLFNGLTGSNQKVGNWPGVTVERIEGEFRNSGKQAAIVDLPGIYALSADSEDEKAARDFLLSGEADLVLNVIDVTNLERNLYLTSQIRELGIPMAAVFTMADRLDREGIRFFAEDYTRETGIPAILINATRNDALKTVRDWLADRLDTKELANQTAVEFPRELEAILADLESRLKVKSDTLPGNPRWTAIKLLEGDSWVAGKVLGEGVLSPEELNSIHKTMRDTFHEDGDIVLADTRYKGITDLAGLILKREEGRKKTDSRIDRIVMNRFLGLPIFLGVMYLAFWFTMTLGGAFIDFFDITFGALFVDGLGALLSAVHAPEWLIGFLAGGLGTGIQTISTFIPIIFTMFFMLSILEDSGYMARAAFVMDRFMRMLGLPGKAFVPMLVGFGCTVPAIMATRTLENRRDRFLAIFMTPFMSCGARLPVYALFGAAFFGRSAGLVVFSIYFAGILMAVLTGLLLKKTLFKGEFSPFIMELPAYHLPRMKMVLRTAWLRLKAFVFRAGKVILLAVTVLTILSTFGFDGSIGNDDSENSILATVGRAITPVFTPMGISRENWPATVGLFTGLFAKEAVVGTLNSLYIVAGETVDEGSGGEEAFRLLPALGEAFTVTGENLGGIFSSLGDPLGMGLLSDGEEEAVAEEIEADAAVFQLMRQFFTPASAYAYLLFVLLYFPCVAALGAAIRETGRFYGTVLVTYLTLLAWSAATIFYQIAEGHNILLGGTGVLILALLALSFVVMGKNRSRIDAAVL